MIVLIIGISGSGKGTQASLLAQSLGVKAVSMGELLRREIAAKTGLGRQVEDYLSTGKWVPSELTFEILKPQIANHPKGFILDGFPRLLDQLNMFEVYLEDKGKQIGAVIYLKVEDQEAMRRLLLRAEMDQKSTGNARHDDKGAVIAERLKSFHDSIEPILSRARQKGWLLEVDGERTVEEIHEDIMARIGLKHG